jgi:Cytochrome P460
MKSRNIPVVIIAALLAALGGMALAVEDKYALKTPSGVAFSDFKGYEGWQVVSVARTDERLKVIVANPTMIDAYRAGVPGNGQPFPDGSKIAKLEWHPKKSTEAPFVVDVPDTFAQAFFIERTARDFRTAPDGATPCSIMTPRPTRSRPIPAPQTADTRAMWP